MFTEPIQLSRWAASGRFMLLCLCWGSTFIPLKAGLATLPPLFFAGLRFVLTAAVLGAILILRKHDLRVSRWQHLGPIILASLLIITFNYGLLFWSARFLPSGVAGLVSFGSVALALTGGSQLLRLERSSLRALLGLTVGLFGLGLLIHASLDSEAISGWGVMGVGIAGLAYGAGSLYIRPLVRRYGVLVLTTWQMTLGGGVLLLLSRLFEPSPYTSFATLYTSVTLLSLSYLVVVGSLLGFWLYNHLLISWPASRLALYNFVSPLIALLLGCVIFQERLGPPELVAILCLLGGVVISYSR
jgi:drug/metabolite transporter (DMT)-like permease